ncbi:MAG: cache domain-containing protein [Oscillospiraceae bacterium]|nr:cache domain-containing protein [Oscillospiraceae bacterium]
MSRLSTKLLIVVGAALLIVVLLVSAVSINMSSSFSSKLLTREATALANVCETKVLDEAGNCWEDYELIAASGALGELLSSDDGQISDMFEGLQDDELDFLAVYGAQGNRIWESETYDLSADFSRYAGKASQGLYDDPSGGLCVIYINTDPDTGCTLVIGRKLADNALVEEIKESTGAECAIFYNAKTIATTLRDKNGTLQLGGAMNDKAKESIYSKQTALAGRTKAAGVSMFYQYNPGFDIDGKLVCAFFSGLHAEESDAEFRNIIILVAAIAVAFVAAAFAAGAIVLRRLIDQPIREANRPSADMSRGELSKPDTDFKFNHDEIGDFVRDLRRTKKDISAYIADISSILGAMGEGDFTKKPSVEYIGDFQTIERSFTEIELRLAKIVGRMDSSADGVRSGAGQIANGSQLLAEGTTRQATAIEELNATLANINTQIASTAQNADRANEISSFCLHKVEEQNDQMNSMLSAMDEIRDKSAKISAIIKTIEDIAFQTNILSLNASVEAARAGAAGKGFAVVADEVRNLATKSAEAANDTNRLITDTVKAVNEGVELAQRTAKIMGEVIEQTKQTNSIIGEINTAAASQAEAVTQVSLGISDISGVISQNSATAEETAASCQELASQSNLLKEQVDLFKV